MGGKGSGINEDVQKGQLANSTALTAIAQQQANRASQLFQTTYPGMQQAEGFEQSLSTGDPSQIMRAIAPATQQIQQATNAAKQNIMLNAPSGGEKNLALEQADVAQGAQVGNVASQGYLQSFNALAQLAGSGIGLGNSAAGTGISGYSAANQGLANLGQQQVQSKGASLGALGALGGDALSGLSYGLTKAFA